ncbi:helix-turn-helix domain-containing protein [Microvirga lotononidis]|uniref:Replication protein C N-terminal domain n=1 Tax=Microvirga lotononidis TaxID=864069 RepID=I4Z359_9HYPH|nr:helix-turn-helix domain-containing protein [Microvirga lotononidis]EIM30651.1 Replication protein C N-terminal domain [Microvirga lotononidis]WQO30377.1 helix-turn-helix domain-containing protein [Microvirga lotononidis]
MKAAVARDETDRPERTVAPFSLSHAEGEADALKAALFKAAQHAGIGLKLLGTDRAVLAALVACFHSRPLTGSSYVVWPSDQTLVDRTRRSRRTVHYSLNRLIDLGLIDREASATRRRFAITRRDKTVVKAFGINLEPLLVRAGELSEAAASVRLQREQEANLGTMIAAERAAMKRALAALQVSDPERLADWVSRFDRFDAETPRWTKSARPSEELLGRWTAERRAIESELPKSRNSLFFSAQIAHQHASGCAPVETLPKNLNEVCYKAASAFDDRAGKGGASSGRPIDTDTVAPEGLGEARVGVRGADLDVLSSHPGVRRASEGHKCWAEAEAYELGFHPAEAQEVLALLAPLSVAIGKSGRALGGITDVIQGAHRLRRVIGLNQMAWVEALATIGDLDTYMLAYWTVQQSCLAERGLVPTVTNSAGLFRSSIQKIASGAFSLRQALVLAARKAGPKTPSDVANLSRGKPNSREDSEFNPFLRDSRVSACYGVNQKVRFSGRLHLSEAPEQPLESKTTH